MTFKCDRCGSVYSTKQELREGRVYQVRCQACGHSIRLTLASRPPIAVARPGPAAPQGQESRPARPPQAPSRSSGELTPPPPGGYFDLVLDDSEPQDPKGAVAAPAPPPAPEVPEPPRAREAARILATAGKPASRRRLGAGSLVAIAAMVVLFGAVGAMALRRPQREEERVSRALLPRAEWVGAPRAGAEPSPGVLAALEDDDQPATPEAGGDQPQPRTRDRARPRPASRALAPVAISRIAPAQRAEPAPTPLPLPAAEAVAPPAVAAATPAHVEQAEDAPQFVRQGFRAPAQESPNCVQSSVRIPRDLQDFVSGPVTVRFAVDRDGSVGRFRVEGKVPDPRIAEAIWTAVRECRFSPGTDDQGHPVKLWVVMPVRFVR